MSKRYVDADKLAEMIRAKGDTMLNGKEIFLYIAKWLEFLPPADVVEVVRCKECKYHDDCICVVCEEENTVVCKKMSRHFPKDHYCSYGERSEE